MGLCNSVCNLCKKAKAINGLQCKVCSIIRIEGGYWGTLIRHNNVKTISLCYGMYYMLIDNSVYYITSYKLEMCSKLSGEDGDTIKKRFESDFDLYDLIIVDMGIDIGVYIIKMGEIIYKTKAEKAKKN